MENSLYKQGRELLGSEEPFIFAHGFGGFLLFSPLPAFPSNSYTHKHIMYDDDCYLLLATLLVANGNFFPRDKVTWV